MRQGNHKVVLFLGPTEQALQFKPRIVKCCKGLGCEVVDVLNPYAAFEHVQKGEVLLLIGDIVSEPNGFTKLVDRVMENPQCQVGVIADRGRMSGVFATIGGRLLDRVRFSMPHQDEPRFSDLLESVIPVIFGVVVNP